jgi:single-strand DNA-binding protein
MQNMNQVIIEGNMSCDPLLRYTSDDKPVTNFSIYVDSKYKNKNYTSSKDKMYLKKTNKVPIVAWSGKAEYIAKNYQKGDKVRLVGHLRTKEIQLDSGKRIMTFEVVAKNISLINRPNNSD